LRILRSLTSVTISVMEWGNLITYESSWGWSKSHEWTESKG
jgi:hypothetical protein